MKKRPTTRKASRTKLVLFDLDGTLAESMDAGLAAMNLLRFAFGYKKLDRDDPRLRLTTGLDFVKNILGLNIFQLIVWAKLLKYLVSRQAPVIGIYDGWQKTLIALAPHYDIGLMTSAPRLYAETILRNTGIAGVFNFLKTDVKYHRKDAALAHILKEQNLQPGQVLYVGDEVRDLSACAKVGVPFVAVDWGKDHGSLFLNSDQNVRGIISQPSDLTRHLRIPSRARKTRRATRTNGPAARG